MARLARASHRGGMARFRPGPSRPSSDRPSTSGWSSAEDDTWLLPLPVPDAREGGESTWALWHEAARELEEAFAPTQPSDQVPLSTAAPPREVPHEAHRLSSEGLMTIARRNNRVCPRPAAWHALYAQLEGERYVDLEPPPIAIWTKLSDLQKRVRFKATIEWAERHGKLDVVAGFILELPEDDWLHM